MLETAKLIVLPAGGMVQEIEAVFLDAAGTLFTVRGSVGEIYSRIAAKYGVAADPLSLDQAFRRAFREKSPLTGSTVQDVVAEEKRWWSEVVAQVFSGQMPSRLFREYFDEVFEFFRTSAAWQLFPDSVPSLERLTQAGYTLGIISNFDSRLLDLLANLGIDRFFRSVTLSWRTGAAKPDPAIFLKAVETVHVPPGSALHVGDSIDEDYRGAIEAGLQAVLLDRRDKHSDVQRVQTLDELCHLLNA